MRILGKILMPCIALFACLCAVGQPLPSSKLVYDGRFSDTIPYTIIEDKLIIEGEINGKPARFFIDTGGTRSLISNDTLAYYGAVTVGSELLGDASGTSIKLSNGYLPNLSLGEHFLLSKASVTFIPASYLFKHTLGVVGSIGADLLSDIVLTIDSEKRVVILNYPYRPGGRSKEGNVDASFKHSVPYVTFDLYRENINVMFDTGAPYFFSLSPGDYQKLNDKGLVERVASQKGHFDVGFTGDRSKDDSNMGLVVIDSLKIGSKQFDGIKSLIRASNSDNTSIMGLGLIKYGNIMIDYPRQLFFFFPHETDPTNVSDDTKTWNIGILKDRNEPDHFNIGAVLGDVDVTLSERIWSINGVPLESVDWRKITFNKYLKDIEGDQAIIEVGENKSKLRKVTIRRL